MKPLMYKIQFTLTLIAIVAIAVIFYLHFASEKIAYVDSTKLVNSYQGMVDARAMYQQKSAVWKANIDTLASEVQKAIKDYEKEKGKMTAKEKEVTQELIRTKQKQLNDYQKALSEKAALEDNQLTSKVLNEVNAFIKSYGDQYGYKIILVATQYGNIAYAEEGLDITDVILEGLNKEYKGN